MNTTIRACAVTIALSFGSLLTPDRVPIDANLKLLRMHVPEALGPEGIEDIIAAFGAAAGRARQINNIIVYFSTFKTRNPL